MRARIRGSDARHDRVDEHHGAVTGAQIAPVQSRAEQQRIRIRVIVVRGEQLVEAAIEMRERQRLAANANTADAGRYPERRIGGADEKFGGWWRSARARVVPARAAFGAHDETDGHERARSNAETHRANILPEPLRIVA
jgi:hypothetical protein